MGFSLVIVHLLLGLSSGYFTFTVGSFLWLLHIYCWVFPLVISHLLLGLSSGYFTFTVGSFLWLLHIYCWVFPLVIAHFFLIFYFLFKNYNSVDCETSREKTILITSSSGNSIQSLSLLFFFRVLFTEIPY